MEYKDKYKHERLVSEFLNTVTEEMLLEPIDLHEEILQTDLYKLYDQPGAKEALKEILSFMDIKGLMKEQSQAKHTF